MPDLPTLEPGLNQGKVGALRAAALPGHDQDLADPVGEIADGGPAPEAPRGWRFRVMNRDGELFDGTEPIDLLAVIEDEKLITALQQRRRLVSDGDTRLTAMLAAWRDEFLGEEDPAVAIWRATIHEACRRPMAHLLSWGHGHEPT
jgi:hypothetical protein